MPLLVLIEHFNIVYRTPRCCVRAWLIVHLPEMNIIGTVRQTTEGLSSFLFIDVHPFAIDKKEIVVDSRRKVECDGILVAFDGDH